LCQGHCTCKSITTYIFTSRNSQQSGLHLARRALEAFLLRLLHTAARENGTVRIGVFAQSARALNELGQHLAFTNGIESRPQELARQQDGTNLILRLERIEAQVVP